MEEKAEIMVEVEEIVEEVVEGQEMEAEDWR